MWRELKICERTYFLHCSIKPNTLECLLYDLQGSWSERVPLDEALKRVKTLNKRIQYVETTVRATLEQNEPTTATWEQGGDNVSGDGLTQRILKLKYHVDKCPFNFEWHLSTQSGAAFTRSLMAPLFQAVHCMSQLLDELQQTVSKKDIEIAEYKRQYGNLTLKHLATQPFNIAQFEEKCKESKRWSSGAEKIVLQLKLLSPRSELSTTEKASAKIENEQPKAEIKTEQSPSKTNANQNKISPRNRKRQAQELQQRRLERKVSARKRKLEYCSNQTYSDSQSSIDQESCAATASAKRRQPVSSTTDEGSDAEPNKTNTTTSSTKVPPTPPLPRKTTTTNKPTETKEATTKTAQNSKMAKIESANTESSTAESESELSKKVDAILAELKELDRRSKADLINSRTELPAVSAAGARTRSKH